MKKIMLLIMVLIVSSCNQDNLENDPEDQACDGGTFVGEARLTSQAEVDAFGTQCYTKINGTLFIGPSPGQPSDIIDLSPLGNLTEIFTDNPENYAKLWIGNNPILSNLFGLHNITKADALVIRFNPSLTDLNGLNSLTALYGQGSLQHLLINQNDNLESLDGLENLTVVGSEENLAALSTQIAVYGNNNLTNIDGLSNIENVYGEINIGDHEDPFVSSSGNLLLNDFCGLINLLNNGFYEEVTIGNNAYNPTVQDIVDGNCSQ